MAKETTKTALDKFQDLLEDLANHNKISHETYAQLGFEAISLYFKAKTELIDEQYKNLRKNG